MKQEFLSQHKWIKTCDLLVNEVDSEYFLALLFITLCSGVSKGLGLSYLIDTCLLASDLSPSKNNPTKDRNLSDQDKVVSAASLEGVTIGID